MSSYLITLAAPAVADVNIGEAALVTLKLGPSGPPLPSLNAYPPEAHAASHAADGDDPLTLSKAQVGLGSVDNTPDTDKPVSTPQAAADADVLAAAADDAATRALAAQTAAASDATTKANAAQAAAAGDATTKANAAQVAAGSDATTKANAAQAAAIAAAVAADLAKVDLTDARLTDSRTPTGAASGDLGGTYPSPTVGQASGAFKFTGIITPSALSGATDNWAPSGFSTSALIRASSSAAVNLTGLAGGASGMVVFLHNIGAYTITLKDESGSSTSANRFALASDTDLAPDSILLLQYDATSARWRACGGGVPTDFGQKAIWNYVPLERDITGAITLAASDNATWINGNKAADFTVTIDGNVTLPPGFNFAIYQQGVGKITVAGTNGATIVNQQGATKTAGQYAPATVKRIGSTSTYVLMGTVQ